MANVNGLRRSLISSVASVMALLAVGTASHVASAQPSSDPGANRNLIQPTIKVTPLAAPAAGSPIAQTPSAPHRDWLHRTFISPFFGDDDAPKAEVPAMVSAKAFGDMSHAATTLGEANVTANGTIKNLLKTNAGLQDQADKDQQANEAQQQEIDDLQNQLNQEKAAHEDDNAKAAEALENQHQHDGLTGIAGAVKQKKIDDASVQKKIDQAKADQLKADNAAKDAAVQAQSNHDTNAMGIGALLLAAAAFVIGRVTKKSVAEPVPATPPELEDVSQGRDTDEDMGPEALELGDPALVGAAMKSTHPDELASETLSDNQRTALETLAALNYKAEKIDTTGIHGTRVETHHIKNSRGKHVATVLPGQLKIHELSDALVKAAYEMWGPNLAFGDNSTDTFKQQFAAIAKRLAADGQLKGPNNTEIKPEDLKINSGEATPEVATPVLEAETVPPTKKPTIYTEATATAAAPDRHKEMQNLSPEGQADAETKAKAQHLLIPADATDAQIRAIALQAHTLQQQGADVHVGAAKEEHFAAYQKAREQIERLAQGYSLDGSGQIGINGQSTFKPSQAKPISLQQLTSETAAAPIKPLTSSDLTLLAAKEHRQAVANAQLAKEKAAKATIDNDAFLAAIPEDVKLAAKRHQAQEKTPATAEPKTTATAASVLNPRRHAGLAPRM